MSNGIKADLASGHCIWNGLRFEAHIDWRDPYVADALLADVSYFEIKRRMFESGWRYYLVVVLQGSPPKKINDIKRKGATPGGVDSGPSTLAYVSEKKAILTRLAPHSEEYGKRIRHLQKENNRLLRNMNAENYNPDGTVRKGRHEWKSSSRIRKNKRLIKTLYRKKAEYVRQSHYELVNQIISDCSELYLEPMHYKALQKRSSRTERSEKICTMQKKDGTVIAVHKYKKKKRFGKSIGDHAPAEMIALLKQRCEQYHVPVHETNCRTMKASQYNPLTGEYESSDLNIRIKKIGKHNVQRDLLSAYITANADETLTYPDPERCLSHWKQFLRVHDKEISRMKAEGISFKSCFGF